MYSDIRMLMWYIKKIRKNIKWIDKKISTEIFHEG